jgi:hypothetical protein
MGKICLEQICHEIEKKYHLKNMFNIWVDFYLLDLGFSSEDIQSFGRNKKCKCIQMDLVSCELYYEDIFGIQFRNDRLVIEYMAKCLYGNIELITELTDLTIEKMIEVFERIESDIEDYFRNFGINLMEPINSSKFEICCCESSADPFNPKIARKKFKNINTYSKFQKKEV